MSYPSPPAPRIPYDADGTRILVSRNAADVSAPVELPKVAVSALNSDIGRGLIFDENVDWFFGQNRLDYYARSWIALMFPRPMSLRGWALSAISSWGLPSSFGWPQDGRMSPLTVRLQVSSNSTNGLDGKWVTVATKDELDSHLPYLFDTYSLLGNDLEIELPAVNMDGVTSLGGSFYDSNILANYSWFVYDSFRMLYGDGPAGRGWADLDLDNVAAVRLYFPSRPKYIDTWVTTSSSPNPTSSWLDCAIVNLHLYGYPTDPDQCLVFRNASDTGRANFHFGDAYLEVPAVRQFKVKNLHTKTAERVVISVNPDDSHVQTSPQSLTLSLDGVNWAYKVHLGDIAPGGISSEVYIRLLTGPGVVGRRSALVVGKAGRWL